MSLAEDIRLLSQVPLFKDMNNDQLRLVAFGAERRQVAPGQELFREKSPAESAFIVAKGRFELLMSDRNGEMKVEATVGPGTLLSELALVTMVERKFTALAITESEALKISRTLFHRLLEEYPEVGRVIESRIRDNIASLAKAAAAMGHRFA
ncbi:MULTISPECIES: cyclic nucleotide-binding domain-containing protein [Rhizobium/Agrobacterium group]|uniref:Cyclic nucleotide-binding domain-containing protein n=2 Tax=Neorhizobium TaxID=1525371 RepID=A0ABV0LYD2_9HYPH|nr:MULTISPECIES: cyclic nucleotide-binding domain-containing protein [Rhizobium/Agrobacterium group]KGD87457.1 protein kinase [Rhizobium sp. YS-1r]MCC2612456.1 cyclic nucleotide-binding domain-containing protein [Neorhizobium petrolearium]WGI67585.1 cyclic nucleotide-binding domain-containing protein [Neorhizobium petrolearium]